MDLTGKRLLVLGSTALISQIVQKAQSLGVTVGVTDYVPYEKSLGKQIADEFFDVSLSDIEGVANLIREHDFDGVITGFSDSYLFYYQQICEAAGVPCYGSTYPFEIATDKCCFKNACRENGVGVIPGGVAKSFEEATSLAQSLEFPLILKPTDNSGSRGVIQCDSLDCLQSSYEYALSYSPSKSVIIERFMDCDCISVSYCLVDGEIRITSTCDRGVYISEGTGSPIASSLKYPSKYHERYLTEVNEDVVNMLKACGFEQGMLSIQAFVDEKGFYFCEMCYRPSGGHHYIVIQDQTGEDELAMLIEYALCGEASFGDATDISGRFTQRYSLGKILGKPGSTISSVRGLDLLSKEKNVLYVSQSLREGDKIGNDGTTAQVIACVWYRVDSDENFQAVFEKMCANVSVVDDGGKNLIKVKVG